MRATWNVATLGLAVVTFAVAGALTLAQGDAKKNDVAISVWNVAKDGASIEVIVPGVPQPKSVAVSADTVISGVCLDCMLPLKYKASESAKKCAVCGCDVTNAACIVGKTVKPATLSQTLQDLAYGTVLHPTYVEVDKPESGLKAIAVDRKSVLLPVDGLSAQTPDQLAALVKAVAGTKAALVDGGTRLTFAIKDWTPAGLAKLDKAIVAAGGKIVRPEAAAATK